MFSDKQNSGSRIVSSVIKDSSVHGSRQQWLVAEWLGCSVTVRVRARARGWGSSLFFFFFFFFFLFFFCLC